MELKKEQYSAINEYDGKNLMVSASAGSGKTFVMIERIIRLISTGKLKVDELLAVTFTEKAAHEMKEKLIEALIENINAGSKSLKSELLAVSSADICTIDAFCSRLVKRYFYELGIGRDFEILSNVDKVRLTDEAISATFKKYYDSKDETFKNFIKHYSEKRSDKPARELILRIYNFASSEADMEKWLSFGDTVYTESGFSALIKEYENLLKEKIKVMIRKLLSAKKRADELSVEKYSEAVDEQVEILEDIIKANSLEELKSLSVNLSTLPPVKRDDKEFLEFKGPFQRLRGDVKKNVNNLLSSIKTEKEYFEELQSNKAEYSLIKTLVLEFSANYDAIKKDENKFDFNDVEKFALELLRKKNVRDSVSSKYKNVFIDEYQDVNGIQEEIFSLIRKDNGFMVGDVKQSIYGFRGCNHKLFENLYNEYSALNQTITLNHNFRSADKVIDAVNAVFDEVITKEGFGVDYKKDARLTPGGLYPENSGSCTLHVITNAQEEETEEETLNGVYDIVKESEKIHSQEEDCISQKVKEIITSARGKNFYDIKKSEERKVTLSDIVILCRKTEKTVISLIKNLTNSGIPIVSEIESSVLDTKEVKLLTAFLRLIDNKKQDVPLVLCLLSRIGSFTADEIASIRVDYKKEFTDKNSPQFYKCYESALKKEGELYDRLRAFDEYISSMRFLADYKSAKFVIEKLIRDKRLSAFTLFGKLGAIKDSKVTRFINESVATGKELSVREFLYKIENSPESFTVSETAGGEAVTIMTEHKSKGLEFPVVIIVGLEMGFGNKDMSTKVLLDRKYGFAIPTFNEEDRSYSSTIHREVVKKVITENQRRDEARLFYVAMTRAKHDLHMISYEKKIPEFCTAIEDANRYYEFIPQSFPRVFSDGKILALQANGNSRHILIGKENKELAQKIKNNLTFSYPFIEETSLPMKTSVTKNAVSEEEASFVLYAGEETENKITTSDGVIDAETGTKVHKILEHFDFSATDISSEINRVITNLGEDVLGITEKDLSSLNSVLKSPIMSVIKKSKLYLEQYFVIKAPANEVIDGVSSTENVMLQGVIDLLAIDGDKAYIIDYKYSAKSPENIVKTYAKQLSLYKTAVENALKIKVEKTVILNLFYGQQIDINL